ncbi:hypothetical protein ASPWEDRAFT_27350 [Aspergillus wentii DTO 134E9]|uniref:Uncharacterized protein n=1 Tax=Aspergillus wentii DTO 134E9 TaxID=1073089 RepID=A0A1L9RI90_ASPWE|nr:uncharacterized protein ASPWEDRAFT_27350 [Aspergillus wentii DTO 134E9]OJJ34646.1 hypothetical protein ASPWEDRAFT_27350 [Aspergillus wentii DTO 134E9]
MAVFSLQKEQSGPVDWEKDYAKLEAVSKVPFRDVKHENKNAGFLNVRDVYLDAKQALNSDLATVAIFTDVLAFKEEKTVIKLPASGSLSIYSRLLTTSGKAHLELAPQPNKDGAVLIYASEIEGEITYSLSGSATVSQVELGVGSRHVAITLAVGAGKVEAFYQDAYEAVEDYHEYFQQLLETQLRIASVLFWSKPGFSFSLASHVAKASVQSTEGSGGLVNMQAVALGQQLTAQAMTGPNMNFFPVLQVGSYQETLQMAIDAADAFEKQYQRFQDKSQSVDDRRQAGEQMLAHAKGKSELSNTLVETALAKYDAAAKAVRSTQATFEQDRFVLENASRDLERGIEKWKESTRLQAAFSIITAIISFAAAIGSIAMGDPSKVGDVAKDVAASEKAIEAVEKADVVIEGFKKIVQSATMKKISTGAKALFDLYGPMDKSVQSIKSAQWSFDQKLPTTDEVSGANGDAAAIQSLASWDKWRLEADDQLAFPIAQGIGGASAYQLALRKHAINGKQLAQAQAEAIKAGQGYVRARLEQHLAGQDLAALKTLVENLTAEEHTYNVAQAKFFDRYMALRTTIAIDMQNLIWAERFMTLSNSSVVVDPLKEVADYKEDLSRIHHEIETAKSKYSSDFQEFTYKVPPNTLPSNYLPDMVQSLRNGQPATFTLLPNTSHAKGLGGPFKEGYHFRIDGMEVTLKGVKPKNQDDRVVSVIISTSGTYADIQDDQVYNFTSRPLERTFQYQVDAQGNKGDVEIRAIYESKDYAMPTPFTQWTVQVKHPESLDLSGLEEVVIEWKGKARFFS